MSRAFLGVDLGTSSVKVVALDGRGRELGASQVHYPMSRPQPQWAEQDPQQWWMATCDAIRQVVGGLRSANVSTVGLSGQMHGLVLVDDAGTALRPAITWSDGRSGEQVARWTRVMDPAVVESISGMPPATGMMAASLAWLQEYEPAVVARASAALLPKDYLRARLTGVVGTEPTDAAGTVLFDIRDGRFSPEIAHALGINPRLFPPIGSTLTVAGRLTAQAATETGLVAGTPVGFGGSDQAMAALALGLEDPSLAAVALGSGGTVFKRTMRPLDGGHGLHVIPFVESDSWLAMGVVLAAGLAVDWLIGSVFGRDAGPAAVTELMAEASRMPAGADGLIASPHLGGIRTPRADQSVRSHFVGLGFAHGQGHLVRALVEGIGFSLCDSLKLMASAGEPTGEITLSGGAARFLLWPEVIAGISGLPVRISSDLQHSAIGAAMAGAIAVGSPLPSRRDKVVGVIRPTPESIATYACIAEQFHAVNDALSATSKIQRQHSVHLREAR